MPTSTATVFCLLIKNKNEADVVNYTAITVARVLGYEIQKQLLTV